MPLFRFGVSGSGIGRIVLPLLALLSATSGLAARDLSGSLYFPERIALPPAAAFGVEARDHAGRIVARTLEATDGRQVPFDFVLPAVPDTPVSVLGAVFVNGAVLRVSDPVMVPAGAADLALGDIRLHPHLPMGFATTLRCGARTLQLGYFGDEARLRVGREIHRLRPEPAASGTRHVAIDDPETWVWSKGDVATVSLGGETLPECVPATAAAFLPLTASDRAGNGGGMRLSLDRAQMVLALADRVLLEVPTPAAQPVEGAFGETAGYRFAPPDAGVAVTVLDRVCALPGALPQPFAVMVETDGKLHELCGGSPLALLADGEWRVVRLEDKDLDEARGLTIGFGEGRVFGNSGCNRYSGGMSVSASGLVFGGIAATRRACAPDRMELEGRYWQLLGRVAGFSLDKDGALLLHDADGAVLIVARR